MAADKTHLKTKLIPTDQKTDAGRIIYKNAKTGELHSELSITFQYPKGTGLWINVPSIHNGKLYNQKQIMRMLKNGDIQPTSNHTSEAEAIEQAIFRSNNLQHVPATSADYTGADINEDDVVSIDAEVPVADTKIQSSSGVAIKNKAKRIAAASQSRNLTEILNQVDAQHADDYYKYYPNSPRNTDPNWSGSPQPERILNKATQYLDQGGQANLDAANAKRAREREEIIGQAMSAYGPRTGPEVPKRGSFAGSSAELSMGVNPDKHHVSRDRYADMAVNEAENKFQMQDIRGLPKKGSYAGSSTTTNANLNTRHPAYQAMLARIDSRDNESLDIPILGNDTVTMPPVTPVSNETKTKKTPIFDSYRNEEGTLPTGPTQRSSRKGREKPIIPEYITIPKDVKPDYGEMPGFKFSQAKGQKKGQGFWSADETSDFWQTDAGYEKAMQTWGEKPGWVKPGFRPKKKELDVNAIKKWFTPSK